jgi:hypothetical protein
MKLSPSTPCSLLYHANNVVALHIDLAESRDMDLGDLPHELLGRGARDAELIRNAALIDQPGEQRPHISQDRLVHQRSLDSSVMGLTGTSCQKRARKARWTAGAE